MTLLTKHLIIAFLKAMIKVKSNNKDEGNLLEIFLAFFTFFLIFTFPGALQLYKAPLFILVAGIAILSIAIKKKTGYVPVVFVLCSLFLIRGIWGTVIGIIKDTPGVYNLTTIYIYWVIVYMIFVSQITNHARFRSILYSIIIGSFLVAFIDIFYLLEVLNFIPSSINPFHFYYAIYEPYDYSFAFGYSHGKSIEFMAYNINLLFFSYPFIVGLLLLYEPVKQSIWTRKSTLAILLTLSTLVVFLSNRRMLILIMMFTPFIISFFASFLHRKKRKKVYKIVFMFTIFGILSLGYLLLNYADKIDIDVNTLIYEFTKLTDNNSTDPRFNQVDGLLNHWLSAPIEGQGSGAGIPNYTRNIGRAWRFELSYHLHLMQLGIVGFALELIFYIGIFFYGIKIIKKYNDSIMVALLSGCLALLIANATNPYTNSFDFLWPLFLPLAYINLIMLKEKKTTLQQ